MKIEMLLGGLMLLGLAGVAPATIVANQDWNVGQMIADNSLAGTTLSQTISVDPGLASAGINGVSVRLNICGGYNGDLFGYLSFNGQTVVLLDRVGKGGDNTYGYGNTGFDITLSDSGTADLHNYQTHNPSCDVNGKLTGTWATDQSGTTAIPGTLASFNGMNPNGTWTLFLADLSAGGQSAVQSWGLDISVVPEPITWALVSFGGMTGLILVIRRRFVVEKIVPAVLCWRRGAKSV